MSFGAELPIPAFFDPDRVGEVWRVRYEDRAREARGWAAAHGVEPASDDGPRIGLLAIDVQNTFCIPGFELFVGGRSGRGAVDDNARLCAFVYRNLARIDEIVATLDTHGALQIFHALFLEGPDGQPPAPHTRVSAEDVASGRWRVNPKAATALGTSWKDLNQYLTYYTAELYRKGRYDLTVWPYHAMLGGIGHALVPAVEEAIFFHTVARVRPPVLHQKGTSPRTESYSALGPEIVEDDRGHAVGTVSGDLTRRLTAYDALVVAGQAKSHCVSWTVQDLLDAQNGSDPDGPGRVYLLEDCTSPVVVPGVVDYTEEADRAYERFAAAGMHVVRSTTPMAEWPGMAAIIDRVEG